MSAEESLFQAYSEWHRLAEAGGKAIRRRNWNFLLECQQALKKIQPLLTRLAGEACAEWKHSGADLPAKEKNIHAVVLELIELEQRNQALLKTARAAAQTKRAELEQAGRNLKRLQHSYVFARPAAWISFS